MINPIRFNFKEKKPCDGQRIIEKYLPSFFFIYPFIVYWTSLHLFMVLFGKELYKPI